MSPDKHSDFLYPRPHCPQCRLAMVLHNTRIDVISDKAERIDVWFCVKHGFYHVRENQPLMPGM